MQDKLTTWFLGLPAIVIILVLMMAASWWFGVKYANKKDTYYQNVIDKKDAIIVDLIEKVINLEREVIESQSKWISELQSFKEFIIKWFDK